VGRRSLELRRAQWCIHSFLIDIGYLVNHIAHVPLYLTNDGVTCTTSFRLDN
jgi:hypothetical protein